MILDRPRPTRHIIGRLLTLVVIASLAAFLRMLGPMPAAPAGTMLLGFLLLAAFVAGELARGLRLPRITGYLIIGIAFGPHVLNLVPRQTIDVFALINDIALSVIALQAGGELRLVTLRERLGKIGTIAAFQIGIVFAVVLAAVFAGLGLFDFLQGQSTRVVLALALIFGLVAVAKSPATTIAVITEMRSRGPLTDTVLGVSVLKDVLILLMIAGLLPAAAVLADPSQGFNMSQLREIALAILWSLLIGTAVGLVIVQFLERINRQPVLFVLAIAFTVVELAHLLGFKAEMFVLMSMAAGFVVQNFSQHGPSFVEALEANSLPLYALFFAVAGAALDLSVLPRVWAAGLLIVLARLIATYVSTYLGAKATRDLAVIARHGWMGFIAQAGVTLGLANIVRERFANWGVEVAAIVVAMIAVNQLIGPPLFRWALVRAGEVKAGAVGVRGGDSSVGALERGPASSG